MSMPAPTSAPAPVDWKAAKKAAKAGRPWFKKKRFILPLILLALIVIGQLTGGGDNSETPTPVSPDAVTQEDAATEEQPADEAPVAADEAPVEEPAAPTIAGVNTPVRDGKFEFTVTGVERVGTTIGEDFLQETAQGEFIIVRVNATNIGDEGQTLSSSGQVLYNDKGQKFEPSSAMFSIPDADKFFLENINPGNSVQGAPLLFDVAPGTVLDHIELHDSMFSGGVEVSLAGL